LLARWPGPACPVGRRRRKTFSMDTRPATSPRLGTRSGYQRLQCLPSACVPGPAAGLCANRPSALRTGGSRQRPWPHAHSRPGSGSWISTPCITRCAATTPPRCDTLHGQPWAPLRQARQPARLPT
jgi:hypothetical protein